MLDNFRRALPRDPGEEAVPPMEWALRHLLGDHFLWRDGTLRIRRERTLEVQQWLAECSTTPLICYALALEWPMPNGRDQPGSAPVRLRELSPSLLLAHLDGPQLPPVDDPAVEQLVAEGLPELHRHLNGSTLPEMVWEYLWSSPGSVSPAHLAGNLDGLEPGECIALLHTARDLRAAIIGRLLVPATMDLENWRDAVCGRLANRYDRLPTRFAKHELFSASALPAAADPAALLPFGGEAEIRERIFLYHAFRLLHRHRGDEVLAAALHAYLLIFHLIRRALIQPRDGAKGFDRFDRYHGLFLREPEKVSRGRDATARYRNKLLQAARSGGVEWLELRTVPGNPAEEVLRLRETVATRPYRSLGARLLEEGRSSLKPRGEVGLIFHFIKKRDRKSDGRAPILPPRHSRLRGEIWRQAVQVEAVRLHSAPYPRVVGVDAANSELNARPEVFAPAIRWLRAQPSAPAPGTPCDRLRGGDRPLPRPLRLTFHVGEDFLHLVSGLRAADEALRFLAMGSGDRIGHGLALGLEYELWRNRIGGEVALPRGEWLDDLVWSYRRLGELRGDFSALRTWIEKNALRLAREVYRDHFSSGTAPDLDLLYRAWKERHRDPTGWRARLIPPTEAAEPEVMTLWHAYHFDLEVRRRHEEVIRVDLDEPAGLWGAAVTALQDELVGALVKRRIAIEVNPTSNLCISVLQELTEHPIFRWHPPEPQADALRPAVVVGSDDPGVFATELAFEYATLARAAELRGAHPREIEGWLRGLRETGLQFSFLDTGRRRR